MGPRRTGCCRHAREGSRRSGSRSSDGPGAQIVASLNVAAAVVVVRVSPVCFAARSGARALRSQPDGDAYRGRTASPPAADRWRTARPASTLRPRGCSPVLVAPDGRPGYLHLPREARRPLARTAPALTCQRFPSVSCENLEARNRSSRSAARAPSLRRSRPRSLSLCPMLLYVAWSPFGHRASVWLPDATAATTGHLRFVHPRHIEGHAGVR